MFGLGKKKNPEESRKKSTIDKLIMGAIVGGAIGSVVGMSLAPKKGKETREYIAQKSKDIYEKGKEIGGKIQEELAKPENLQTSKGIFSRIKGKLFPKKATKKQAEIVKEEEMKKIPHENE